MNQHTEVHRLASRQAIVWELAVVPFEMFAVGVGLYFLLISKSLAIGSFWLCAVSVSSLVARLTYYNRIAPAIHET